VIVRKPRNRQRIGLRRWITVTVLRRPERLTCARCHASHPAIYAGQQCLICKSTIDIATGHRSDVGAAVTKKRSKPKVAEEQHRTQLVALRSERDELRAALRAARSQDNFTHVSDYEWYVELAGKGLAQREKFPMPPSVTTPEAFYGIMAAAALDAIGLRALLNRMAQGERNLETIQDELRQADANAEKARHRRP
jgi:hypothetical protein